MSAKPLAIVAVLLLCAVNSYASPAPSCQQGAKLVGTGAAGFAGQGYSIALSADGSTAIVGGCYDNYGNGGIGAAWVYTRSGGVWSQQGAKLVGTGAVNDSHQGVSVALSADGNTAMVGGPDDNNDVGAAWVYTRNGGEWSQQGTKLVGTGAVGAAIQGFSVALSADGNTAMVGGPFDNGRDGAAWVFTRSGGVWTQQGANLVGTGATGGAQQGCSVVLSADGSTAIIGGNGDDNHQGAVWAFTRSGVQWSQQGTKLVGTGTVGGSSSAQQGCAMALSADGNTAMVGGPYNDAGAAWVYTRSNGVWSQQGTKLVGTGAAGDAAQGSSVALAADGNTAVVGGMYDDNAAGAAWVYTRSGSAWSQQGTKLVGTGATGAAWQGISVALSADGYTAAVGGFSDDYGAGAVWIFIDPKPAIASIVDVGNDQGRQVRLRWRNALYDAPSQPATISGYAVFREQGQQKREVPAGGASSAGILRLTGWDYILTAPAFGESEYQCVAPTLCDSTISDGLCLSTFMIRAMTASPFQYYDSAPLSGYSVDNLAPGVPGNLRLTSPTVLAWDEAPEQDFNYFTVYGSNQASFDGMATVIGHTTQVTEDISGHPFSYYYVTTTDFSGNEGRAASLQTPAGVEGLTGSPARFALHAPKPNPTMAGLSIGFELPRESGVAVRIFDAGGRVAATLVDGRAQAGTHEVSWSCTDGHGTRVATGLYFCRMDAGDFTATRKVVVAQ